MSTRITLFAAAVSLAAVQAAADNHKSDSEGEQQASGEESSQPQGGAETGGIAGKGYASGLTTQDMLDNMIRSSALVGGQVYFADRDWSEEEWAATGAFSEIDDNWQDAGNVVDLVLSSDGKASGLVVEHGGVLDIGDQAVLLSMKDVRRVDAGEDTYTFVTHLTEAELENLPQADDDWF